jgi:hypothetical protein
VRLARRSLLLALIAAALLARPAAAHPGSGIVADAQGQIYFLDTGEGVWKLDTHGALTKLPGPKFHWMAIDPDNRFAKTSMPSGSGWEIARTGPSPTLLLASDFPLTVGPDGNLIYPSPAGASAVQLMKLDSAGKTSPLAKLSVPWVNGLATGSDGSVYVTEDRAIRKIDKQGRVTTVVQGVKLEGCAAIPGSEPEDGPYLRGLDVDAQGTIFVAAAGCGSVLKVTADGKITKMLQTQAPWSPTAIVEVGGSLYVLEYLHVEGDDRRSWVPRVRKISSDGKDAIVATVRRS